MSEQVPTFKLFAIETPVAGTAYENADFIKKCVTEHSQLPKSTDISKLRDLGNFLVFLVEEEEIVALKNVTSASYQKLEATMQPVMTELNCNIFVILGHTNTCFDYLNANEIVPPNTLPTLVLLVACFSERILLQLNTKQSSIDRNVLFFGFQNLMHLLHGEIIACKSPHHALPFLDCRFEEVADDLAVIQANASQYSKPYAEMKDLLKCCRGRYEHFKQVFYDYLVNRECVRFPTESLLAKFQSVRNSDGSFVRDVTRNSTTGLLTMTEDQVKKYIFSRSDGVPCTEETCSAGKTDYNSYKANLKEFDTRVKYGNTVTEKIFEILNKTDTSTLEQHITNDKELLALLKQTPKNTIKSSLLHRGSYKEDFRGTRKDIPLFFFIFAENYKLSSQEILDSIDIPLDIKIKDNYTLVSIIIEHLNRTHKKKTLTEAEAYRLINAIGSKNPNAITVGILSTYPQPFFNYQGIFSIFLTEKCHLSILELLFYKFSDAIPAHTNRGSFYDQFIGKLSQLVEQNHWTLAEGCKFMELLLSFGKLLPDTVAVRHKSCLLDNYEYSIGQTLLNPVAVKSRPVKLLLPFVLLIYIYSQDDSVFPEYSLDNRISYWSTKYASALVSHKPKINTKILKIYQAAKQFFEKTGPPSSHRVEKAEIVELLGKDLYHLETTMSAIENVKTFFSTIQPNISKRKDLEAKLKANTLKQLAANYKNIRITDNEGENAMRRLRGMHTYYSQFLTNHPKNNKVVPNVASLRRPAEVASVWTYEVVEAYLKRLAAAKPKTVRRPKIERITNISALQTQLANIVGQLNAHNSGAKKIHGMTVKRLRRERGEIEQRLRNLTPAVVANAANNNTENENNQGGGRRRTRKLYR